MISGNDGDEAPPYLKRELREALAALLAALEGQPMSDERQGTYDHYSMVLEWEPVGGVYVVTVPELPGCRTHGRTLEEAVKHGQEVIELWVDSAREDGEQIPRPRYFDLDFIARADVSHFTMTGEDDDDALPYQERMVERMLAMIEEARGTRW